MLNETDNIKHTDLYITLNPSYDTLQVKRSDRGSNGFEEFARKNISPYMDEAMSPDNWMLHYRIDPKVVTDLPQLDTPRSRDYFRELLPGLMRCGVTPRSILPFDRALGLADRGLPLLTSTQDARITPLSSLMPSGYDLYLARPHFKAYTALNTSKGVLLFSPTPKGSALFQKYMQWLADNFYSPDMKERRLDIYMLPEFAGDYKQYANVWNGNGEPDTLPQAYLPESVLTHATPCLHYDLEPVWENFARLTLPSNETGLFISQENNDIMCLQAIASGEVRADQIKNADMPFKYKEYFEHLLDIVRDEPEKGITYRDIECEAAAILYSEFPAIRGVAQESEQHELHIPDIYAPELAKGMKL